MIIEKASELDINQILEIEKANFDDPWPKEAFINDLNRNDGNLIVLKDEDKVIGYYDVWYMLSDADLASIAIQKDYQGKGYGELLLKDCIERCIKSKVEYIHLEVKVDNIKALNLYKKLGFKEVRVRKGYYAGVDGIDMVKGLN